MNIDAILEALLTLTPDQLKAIKARCVYVLNKKKTNSEITITGFTDILYMHLRRQGRKLGLNNFPTLEKASQLKPQAIDSFIAKASAIDVWININFKKHLNDSKDLHEKFVAFLVILYTGYIRHIFETINPWNLLACIDYLPQAFEYEFPEYIANGMQGVIINQFIKN